MTTSVGSGVGVAVGGSVGSVVAGMLTVKLSVGFAVTTGPNGRGTPISGGATAELVPATGPVTAPVATPVAAPVATEFLSGALINSFWPIWRILESDDMWLRSRICWT